MTETLAHGYSSESTRRELSNEYQHDIVYMVIKHIYVIVLWTKVDSASEGLNGYVPFPHTFTERTFTENQAGRVGYQK